MKIAEVYSVAPPPGSVPSKAISLSFLDIFWLGAKPVKRFFLYRFPSIISAQDFSQNILPDLKHSLSLALQRFFLAAGSLVFRSEKPYIQYEDGCSVALTVAESDKDFDQLVERDGKMVDYASLLELVPTLSKDEVTNVDPLFGVQVTVFPGCGICIGVSYKHVLGDGRSIMTFLKTWASICKNSGVVPEDCALPLLDRTLVPDPGGALRDTFLKQLASIPASFIEKPKQPNSVQFKVRYSFQLRRHEMQNLRERILSQVENGKDFHLSSFVLTCSLIWICFVKSQTIATKNGSHGDEDDDEECHFAFVLDCCDRYEYRNVVPTTYFGNCLCLGCFASVRRKDLEGENGLALAAVAIGRTIQDTVAKGPMKDADKWLSKILEKVKSLDTILGVAGSPRLGAYGLDFGLGKPEKVEVVSIDDPKSIALAESRDDVGGVEVGLVLDKSHMEAFTVVLEEFKNKYCIHMY